MNILTKCLFHLFKNDVAYLSREAYYKSIPISLGL